MSTLVLPKEPPKTPTLLKPHLAFIDGLRAIAALFVMVCHAYFEPANGYYASRLMNHLGLTYGHIAVDVFIVVSGFCLMLPIARRGDQMPPLKQFFTRRDAINRRHSLRVPPDFREAVPRGATSRDYAALTLQVLTCQYKARTTSAA